MINTKFRKCCVELIFVYIGLPFMLCFYIFSFTFSLNRSNKSCYVSFLPWKNGLKTFILLTKPANVQLNSSFETFKKRVEKLPHFDVTLIVTNSFFTASFKAHNSFQK